MKYKYKFKYSDKGNADIVHYGELSDENQLALLRKWKHYYEEEHDYAKYSDPVLCEASKEEHEQ